MFINNVCHFPIFALFFTRARALTKHVNVINLNRGILKCGFLIYNLAINCPFVMYYKYFKPYLGVSTGSLFMVYIMMIMNEKPNCNRNLMEPGCSTNHLSDQP